MSDVRQILRTTGIADANDVYPPSEIQAINKALDPLFAEKSHQARSYAYSSDLLALGILDDVLSPAMIRIFFDVMDDPVLYHFHVYEIAMSNKSHVFAEELDGWHRDPDSVLEPGEATHVSLFVYLTDVGADGGPFQFLPACPTDRFASGAASVSQTGPAGTTFLWNRSFFHRAAPNRSPVRRRLLKISIQNNRFPSRHLNADHFIPTIAARRYASPWHQLLFGAFQGQKAPRIPKPKFDRPIRYQASAANSRIDVGAISTMKYAMKHRVNRLFRPQASKPVMADAAYD